MILYNRHKLEGRFGYKWQNDTTPKKMIYTHKYVPVVLYLYILNVSRLLLLESHIIVTPYRYDHISLELNIQP